MLSAVSTDSVQLSEVRASPLKTSSSMRRKMAASWLPKMQRRLGKAAHAFEDLVRIRPIADDITQAPGLLDCAGIRQHRLEGSLVGVNVRDDENAHSTPAGPRGGR